MQSTTNTSPLLNHAIKIRAKNVELRKQIAQLQNDIQTIDNEISTLTKTHENLLEQCQILREKQTDEQKQLSLEQYENEFNNYIHEIENFINNKQWNVPSNDKSIASKITGIPIQTLNDDLNQQFTSVENWLMESAVTDNMKSPALLPETTRTDDGTDDLYKDLIFPTFSEDIPASTNLSFDENTQEKDFIKTISPDNTPKQQTRLDKNQRRFVLMRQLAEKSNKTVTKKLL